LSHSTSVSGRLENVRVILESCFYGHSYHTKRDLRRHIGEVLNLLFDNGIVWSDEKGSSTTRGKEAPHANP